MATIAEIGQYLKQYGWRPGQHSKFGGNTGGHAENSYHNYDEALDVTWHESDVVNGRTWQQHTGDLRDRARQLGIFNETLGPGDAGHDTHTHLALRGRADGFNRSHGEWLATGRWTDGEGRVHTSMPGGLRRIDGGSPSGGSPSGGSPFGGSPSGGPMPDSGDPLTAQLLKFLNNPPPGSAGAGSTRAGAGNDGLSMLQQFSKPSGAAPSQALAAPPGTAGPGTAGPGVSNANRKAGDALRNLLNSEPQQAPQAEQLARAQQAQKRANDPTLPFQQEVATWLS